MAEVIAEIVRYTTIMNLTLSGEEVELLRDVLESARGSLREEIYQTSTYEVRQQLKQREAILNALIVKLGGPTAAG
jgi:hypothetical protein